MVRLYTVLSYSALRETTQAYEPKQNRGSYKRHNSRGEIIRSIPPNESDVPGLVLLLNKWR